MALVTNKNFAKNPRSWHVVGVLKAPSSQQNLPKFTNQIMQNPIYKFRQSSIISQKPGYLSKKI